MDGDRNRPPVKLDAFLLGMFVFIAECRDVLLFAAIENVHFIGAQPLGRVGGVDRGVPRSDDNHLAADRDRLARLIAGDELQRVDHLGVIFAGNAELAHRAQANAQKDDVELPL